MKSDTDLSLSVRQVTKVPETSSSIVAKLSTPPLKQIQYSYLACCVGTNSISTRNDASGGIKLVRRGLI